MIASCSGDELEQNNSSSDIHYLRDSHNSTIDRGTINAGNYSTQTRLLHEEIALHWVVSSGTAAELSMTNSWFLFELIVKSMIEHLELTQALNSPRKTRFPHQYTDDLATLVHLVTTKVVGLHNTDQKMAQSLNISLGFFLFDLMSIMDRGFVFTLIKTYYKVMISKSLNIPALIHYKLAFLRVICSHEHFVALNLPFATPYTSASAPCSPTPSISSNNSQTSYLSTVASIDKALYSDLSLEYRQQHFIIGLLLTELATVLETP